MMTIKKYSRINNYIVKNKNNDKKLSNFIFKHYSDFLYKYVYLIKNISVKEDNGKFLKALKAFNTKIIFQNWSLEELYNELFILLIQFIKEYSGDQPVQYVGNLFKFYIIKWIYNLNKDIMNHSYLQIEQAFDISQEENSKNTFLLNNNFNLNNLEKYILFLFVEKKLSIEKISKIICADKSIIKNIKEEAKKKIEEEMRIENE